jgi:hypothetical protein
VTATGHSARHSMTISNQQSLEVLIVHLLPSPS